MRSTFALFLLPLILACGDDPSASPPDASVGDAGTVRDGGAPDGGSELDEDGCRILTLGPRDFQVNGFNQLTGIRMAVTPNLDDAATDFLLLELYDSTTGGGLPALAPGSFDLTTDGNDDLATCQHCLWLKVDEAEDGTVDAIYYQTKGTLTLTRVEDPFSPDFAGSTERVVLRRATITEDGRSVLEPGGDCVSVSSLAFDTAPTPGAACFSAEDCGNALLEICDPTANVCAPPQCGDFLGCPETHPVCVSQYRDQFDGACYRACDPSETNASACDDGQRCVQFGVDPQFGLCKHVGDGAVGAACEVTDNSTACAGDAVCSSVTNTCSPSCRFFDDNTGCPSGAVCSLFGVCEPPSIARSAAIGEACGDDAELAQGCARQGDALRGICFAFPPAAPICEKACFGDRGCGAGEFCALRFDSGLGVCRPTPVCGDGLLGEIDEVCDDGNTVSGDGCSRDCRTVEYEPICGGLPVLALGTDVEGDTATAWDGFMSSCQFGFARAEVFALNAPGPGRLAMRVDSPSGHAVALRSACAEPGSELACAAQIAGPESDALVHQVTSTSATSLTAIVSALTVLEEGPFTVRADFVPELCGDAILAGREVCDDGNTASDDGCRGDCRAVEYDYFCSTARTLSVATQTGDTTGRPNLYTSTCSANEQSTSGVDDLYRYVAPSNGTLHLFLESLELMVVAVYDGCGEPAATHQLACNASFTLGTIDLPMVAGQAVTVVVDGFLPTNAGTYTLQASFTPE